ncbi:MAG: hypothetical protein AB7N91_08100 [Candidatus Tectimicrobiota bacterium]
MTDPHEASPGASPEAATPFVPAETPLPPSVLSPVVQQLRDAGFADAEQAALTTAFLRVLALGTQQATRDDLHTALAAVEQRLTPQLTALREDLRRELAQHAAALRDTLQHVVAQQTERHPPPEAPVRRGVSPWLLLALLGLTCAGVLALVVFRILGG